mgnify:CR=1 FL=1
MELLATLGLCRYWSVRSLQFCFANLIDLSKSPDYLKQSHAKSSQKSKMVRSFEFAIDSIKIFNECTRQWQKYCYILSKPVITDCVWFGKTTSSRVQTNEEKSRKRNLLSSIRVTEILPRGCASLFTLVFHESAPQDASLMEAF